jgi:hypothetical protein
MPRQPLPPASGLLAARESHLDVRCAAQDDAQSQGRGLGPYVHLQEVRRRRVEHQGPLVLHRCRQLARRLGARKRGEKAQLQGPTGGTLRYDAIAHISFANR